MSARDDYPAIAIHSRWDGREGQECTDALKEIDSLRQWQLDTIAELNHLRRWKEEATEVIERWNKCAELVPVQLGERASDAVRQVLFLLRKDRGL